MKNLINKTIYMALAYSFIILIFSLFFFIQTPTHAETKINLINNTSERVTDLANIFTPQDEDNIKNKIFEIEKNTKAQIAILTINTLHDTTINPENLDIFQFGIELLSDKNFGWNIGDEQLDTGLFLLIAKEDHTYRFFTGYGLEGVLPDLQLQRIAEAYFPQYFRQKQYSTGVEYVLLDIQKFLENDAEIIQKYTQNSSEEFNKIAILFLLAFSFFAGLFVSEIENKQKKNNAILLISLGILFTILTPYIVTNVGLFSLFLFLFSSGEKNNSGGFSSGNWSSGGGISSGYSFSQFGGGSFGGGGFGGKW